jgi:signal transduction histidine kinase
MSLDKLDVMAGASATAESRTATQTEALLAERVDQLASLAALSDAVARAENLDAACAAALDCLARTLSPDRASVLLFDTRGVMRFRAWRGLSESYRRATEGHTPWSPETRDPEPVLVPDVESEPSLAALRPVIEAEGIRALGFFPLLDRGRLLGKFMVYFDEPHVFTATETRLAQAIGSQVALEIARSRRETELRYLAEASRVLGQSLDVRATLGRFAQLCVPSLGDVCVLDLAGQDGLRRVASAGEPELVDPADLHAVISSGEPRVLDDDSDNEPRSTMILPLNTGGRTLGTMTVISTGGLRRYGTADVEFAVELARRAALAAENGLLHESERRVRGAGAQLQKVTEALAATMTAAEVVDVLVREARASLGATAGWIAELDRGAGELRRLGASGYRPELEAAYSRLPLELDNPTVRAALENTSLWFESARELGEAYPGLLADYRAAGFEAMAIAPLVVAGRTTGVIALNFPRPRRFRDDEKRLLVAVADQCGQALERARLYAEMQDRADAASVLAHVGDGVFQLGPDERVLLWNRGAAVITGIGEEDALARPIGSLILDWRQISPRISITDVPLAVGRRDALPAQIGDRELWLAISGVAAGDTVVYAFRDVTESEELEKARRDFLATASHELRTPLSGVFGAAKTLLHRELDQETRRSLLEVIDDQTARLAQILDELLFASRLDAGLTDVVVNDCDLVPIVKDVVKLQRPRLPAEMTLDVSTGPDLPSVRCDPVRLRQVLLNLLDNAIKYSPDGGTVSIAVARLDDSVRISVADEGLGIPPGERERIFEKFYRLDPAQTRGVGGTGLGLYISRRYIDQMQGRLWVEPGAHRGSAFHVELPVAVTKTTGSATL